MTQWDTVSIIGVGLIGGSIGLALRERSLARRVVGVGRRAHSLRKARRQGAVDTTTTRLCRGVREASLVVVCTPVERIAQDVMETVSHCPPEALITDVGSTKVEIVDSLDRHLPGTARFVGSHPIAGSDKSGPEHARGDLFVDHAVAITPSRRTSATVAEQAERFWQSLGGRVIRMSPRAHDRSLATISHLPHIVASALAGVTPTRDLPLVAGGWRDTTRVAEADVELWRQILAGNRDEVLRSMRAFERVLSSFRHALETGDRSRLAQLLRAGKRNREAVGN